MGTFFAQHRSGGRYRGSTRSETGHDGRLARHPFRSLAQDPCRAASLYSDRRQISPRADGSRDCSGSNVGGRFPRTAPGLIRLLEAPRDCTVGRMRSPTDPVRAGWLQRPYNAQAVMLFFRAQTVGRRGHLRPAEREQRGSGGAHACRRAARRIPCELRRIWPSVDATLWTARLVPYRCRPQAKATLFSSMLGLGSDSL
jgi:hypothetical protein